MGARWEELPFGCIEILGIRTYDAEHISGKTKWPFATLYGVTVNSNHGHALAGRFILPSAYYSFHTACSGVSITDLAAHNIPYGKFSLTIFLEGGWLSLSNRWACLWSSVKLVSMFREPRVSVELKA